MNKKKSKMKSHWQNTVQVMNPHADGGRDVSGKRWEKSTHVCHLKKHKAEYIEAIHNFIYQKYFSQLQKRTTNN